MPFLKRNRSNNENIPSSEPKNPDIKEDAIQKPAEEKPQEIVAPEPQIPKEPLQIRLKEAWKTFWDLFFGRTQKQKLKSKLTYVGRKYFLFFFVFILYSGVLLYLMQNPTSDTWYDIVLYGICFNNPYQFGIGLTLVFVELAFCFSNEKILKLIFEKQLIYKQIILIISLIVGNYYLAGFLSNLKFDITIFLSLLTMIWMVFQSVRIYSGSRKFASGLEAKWVSQYGAFRYLIAIILPYIMLGFLAFVAFFFRFGSVIIALDLFGPRFPNEAYGMYKDQMRIIMPMLYIELMLVFVFIIMQAIFTQTKGSTKRAGVYDSLSYALITFNMFWYVLYNNALFMVSTEGTVNAINSLQGGSSTSSIFFIVEFAISTAFLFWILVEIKDEFQTGLMFFNNDGLVLLLLSTIMAQTTSRVGLLTPKDVGTEISIIAEILSYDRIIIPFLIITILGLTIVLYYRNPQEGSMFLREARVTSTREERTMDTILKYFKREFIRTGKKIPIEDHLATIQKIIGLPPNIIENLINQVDYLNVDVLITEEPNDRGRKIKYFEFIPITEKYQRGTEAELKAQKYLREEFLLNISKERAFQRKLTSHELPNNDWNELCQLLIRSFDLRGYQETQLNKYQLAHPLHFEPYIEISQNLKLSRKQAKTPKNQPKLEGNTSQESIKDTPISQTTPLKPISSQKIEMTENISVKPSDVAKSGTTSAISPIPPKSQTAKAELITPNSDVKTVKISKPESKPSPTVEKKGSEKLEIKTKTPDSKAVPVVEKKEPEKTEIKTKTPDSKTAPVVEKKTPEKPEIKTKTPDSKTALVVEKKTPEKTEIKSKTPDSKAVPVVEKKEPEKTEIKTKTPDSKAVPVVEKKEPEKTEIKTKTPDSKAVTVIEKKGSEKTEIKTKSPDSKAVPVVEKKESEKTEIKTKIPDSNVAPAIEKKDPEISENKSKSKDSSKKDRKK